MAPRPPKEKATGTRASSRVVKKSSPGPAPTKVTKSTSPKSKAAAATKTVTKTATKTASKTATKAATKTTTKAAPKAAPKAKAKADAKSTTKKPTATKSKAAAKKTSESPVPTKNENGKRPIEEDNANETQEASDDATEEAPARPIKRARVASTPASSAGPTGFHKQVALKRRKQNVINNPVPQDPLDIFVFGEGSSGELGLGSKKHEGKRPIDVKRPRPNHNLGEATNTKIVAVACGGMHAIALTDDNRVLTWGVNDDKALGRDTTWSGGLRDADAEEDDDDDDEDDTGVNPHESTPAEIEKGELQDADIICKVAASDSASFVLTQDGFVYGWGTFRSADGIIGFAEGVRVQPTPMLIAPLQDITDIVCGSNHVLAMDVNGKVWSWGSGGQFQLGRKPITRHGGAAATLRPEPCGRFSKKHHATAIAAGSYHSFYIDNTKRVWSWGLNNYAQTGHYDDSGEDDAMVLQPKLVESLKDAGVSGIAGGEHHSVACTDSGDLLTWGRVDGHQVGQPSSVFSEENAVFDENGRPRILQKPTVIPDIHARFVAAGTDTSFAIDKEGHVYSWGFSANYQTGQGTTDDIEVPTVIENSVVRERDILWAGAGGQYSMLASKKLS
ncbi:RCC1/BLIP-II [Xylariaceae sp. FL0594]|nr:RCC1/BLIP-II [Xylariaceae sp. FL0594]